MADYGAEFGQASTDDPGASTSSAFLTGNVSVGSNVFYLEFPDGKPFGYYNYEAAPYLYHFDAGFLYFIDANDSAAGAYLYDFTSSSFWYSNPADWPYVYDFSLSSWLYYFPDTTDPTRYTRNPRYFYDFKSKSIITR